MQRRFFYLKGQPFVFLSADGSGGKGPEDEATLALNKIKHEMEGLGGSIDDLVRTTTFFKNQECRPAIGEVRKKMLPQATRPASSSIIVHNYLPEDTLVEFWATGILARGEKHQKEGVEFDPPRNTCTTSAAIEGFSVPQNRPGTDIGTCLESPLMAISRHADRCARESALVP